MSDPWPNGGQQWPGELGLPGPPRADDSSAKSLATAALACGIIAVVTGLIPFLFFVSIPVGVVALVFGVVAARARPAGTGGRGRAVGGAVTGAVGAGIGLLWILGLFALLSDEDMLREFQRQFERREPTEQTDHDIVVGP